jgi:hypothetical protein
MVLGLSYPLRVIITFFVVGPLGFLMGMPFPLGIRLLSQSNKEFVNWAWAINGCASVIGSILPLIIALYFGFSLVYIIAGIAYILTMTLIIHSDKTKLLDY